MSKERKFKFKGKQVLLLGLVALVITAGYYRWSVETDKYTLIPVTSEALPVNNDSETQDSNEEKNDAVQMSEQQQSSGISKLKQERDKSRGDAIEQWKQTADSKDASQETKSAAEKKVKNANDYTEKETSIETLVKAKGYNDCFAHMDESGVTVVVSGGEINGAKVSQIKDIIISETGVDVKNIKISAE